VSANRTTAGAELGKAEALGAGETDELGWAGADDALGAVLACGTTTAGGDGTAIGAGAGGGAGVGGGSGSPGADATAEAEAGAEAEATIGRWCAPEASGAGADDGEPARVGACAAEALGGSG